MTMDINIIISQLLTLIMFSFLIIVAFLTTLLIRVYVGKSINDGSRPPVLGTVFHQLFYFNRLYDHHTEKTKRHPTFRLLAPDQSEIFTVDVRNVEHLLKTRFENYQKGAFGNDLVRDLLGYGIFAVNPDKCRHQRKLASVEFSARVLKDFSCGVFRKNAARLLRQISTFSDSEESKAFDILDLLLRCAMDSTFGVSFGTDLNCLCGSSKEAVEFMVAFENAHELIFWRFFDPCWKLKRKLNYGSEAALKNHLES